LLDSLLQEKNAIEESGLLDYRNGSTVWCSTDGWMLFGRLSPAFYDDGSKI